jgi:hypothetical protein
MDKIKQTEETIMLLLNSMGPQDMPAIIAECKAQAFAGKIPQAISNLLSSGKIVVSDDIFESIEE